MIEISQFLFTFIVISSLHLFVVAQNNPSCRTPTNFNGQCIPLVQCKNIYDIIATKSRDVEKINLVHKSLCTNPTFSGRSVCCELSQITQPQSTTVKSVVSPRPVIVRITENTPTKLTAPHSSYTGDISRHPNLNLLDTVECGKSSSERISNGDITKLFEYPWMALLAYRENVGGEIKFRCDGSLINKNYVLTAAHCVKSTNSFTLEYVRLGEHNITSETDCIRILSESKCARPVQDIRIETIISHADFNKPRFSNDIALIRLKTPASLSEDDVVPICLPVTEELRRRQHNAFIVTGWGTTEKYEPSPILLRAAIPLVPLAECQERFRSQQLFATLTESQFCAGGYNKSDTCTGDSGGPVQYADRITKYDVQIVQFGIVTFGLKTCGEKNSPGVYANVSYYMPWILDNLSP
uniref:CLIP domain-containing serine protease n=1 Tax=Corethrella appendiculata TaxID=1370023 RepID=U5EMJ9_9DIPT